MKLNIKEIETVSNLESFARYKYFLKKIADFEEFWTIVDKNGEIALSEIEDDTLMSFWTAEDFIKSNLFGNWEKYNPFKVTLDDFEDTLIPLIENNNYLLNIFPVDGKSGFVVNLDEFIRDLNNELEQY
ncbi:DUF2750 domain-containing protein [Flagellimonas taeanensis]|uniref:DUF2750 domain-containing protein n=1 Tax=Flavobacteriaceae TaxID=49546 RepID=UPI000E687B7B|nr:MULTISPECIES: DUF2750 domain-containing protein [Allomuricauda]MDC6384635.1 DUF2750 domain-containing protein [Muricauda sp. SK9]RIV53618.1 DUF2750 domain-containing protein [Allomuricauda taeanensis]